MREILFRGKRIDNLITDFIIGYLIIEPNGTYWIDHYPQGNRHTVEVIPETVCQYTGYKDKNNKMIFEGDILKSPYEKNYNSCVVQWNEKYAAFVIYGQLKFLINRYDDILKPQMEEHTMVFGQDDEFEIIGNIHDNPELIN